MHMKTGEADSLQRRAYVRSVPHKTSVPKCSDMNRNKKLFKILRITKRGTNVI